MLVCDAKGKRGGVDAADPSARGTTPTDAFYTEEAVVKGARALRWGAMRLGWEGVLLERLSYPLG